MVGSHSNSLGYNSPFKKFVHLPFQSTCTLGSRGYFFLMDTDGSRRSRVNEAQSAEENFSPRRFFLL